MIEKRPSPFGSGRFHFADETRITGQPYPKPMHVMLRSTDPAGRAIKAAAIQGPEVERRILQCFRSLPLGLK